MKVDIICFQNLRIGCMKSMYNPHVMLSCMGLAFTSVWG